MARDQDESKGYSFVDVLERVADGVHVQVVRTGKRRDPSRANERTKGAAAKAPKRRKDSQHKR